MKMIKKFEDFDLGRFSDTDSDEQPWLDYVSNVNNPEMEDDIEDEEMPIDMEDCEDCEVEDHEDKFADIPRRKTWGDEVIENRIIKSFDKFSSINEEGFFMSGPDDFKGLVEKDGDKFKINVDASKKLADSKLPSSDIKVARRVVDWCNKYGFEKIHDSFTKAWTNYKFKKSGEADEQIDKICNIVFKFTKESMPGTSYSNNNTIATDSGKGSILSNEMKVFLELINK
jgi:hypothetical protein